MLDFILGIVIGLLTGYILAHNISKYGKAAKKVRLQIESLCSENLKLEQRNKKAERFIEDLLLDNESLHKQVQQSIDKEYELKDKIGDLQDDVNKLTRQNKELVLKIKNTQIE